ncbi:MAG: hypothetical protein ABEJ27_00090 [Halodesulfurarchaeum sp.]
MIRTQFRHSYDAIDVHPQLSRTAVTLGALLSLPILGPGVRVLGPGRLVVSVLASVPVLIAVIAVWSIGCHRCRPEVSR